MVYQETCQNLSYLKLREFELLTSYALEAWHRGTRALIGTYLDTSAASSGLEQLLNRWAYPITRTLVDVRSANHTICGCLKATKLEKRHDP